MAVRPTIPEPAKHEGKPLGLVWITGSYPVAAARLKKALRAKAHVLRGEQPPEITPSLIVLCTNGEDIASALRNLQTQTPQAPVVVLGPRAELSLARSALQAGAKGFVHAMMPPEQVVRAIEVATKGEVAVPRELLRAKVEEERSSAEDLARLSLRQREILAVIAEGLSNAQIARRFFLSESTIKQRLRAIYKLLGVRNYKVLGIRNRNQAARLMLRSR